MSGASGESGWEFSDFDNDDFEAIPHLDSDNGKKSKKTKLDIRRNRDPAVTFFVHTAIN